PRGRGAREEGRLGRVGDPHRRERLTPPPTRLGLASHEKHVARMSERDMRVNVERLAPDVAGAHPGYEARFIPSSAAAMLWWKAAAQLRAPALSGGSGQSWSCASTSPT